MDAADYAKERELERAIAAARRAGVTDRTDSVTECRECGEKLAQIRIEYGFDLCVSCAKESELRKSRQR